MKLLTIQLICAWFLAGVIWVVQVVHYPLFAQVGPDHFSAYEALHAKWITWVVALPMLIELFAAGLWVFDRHRGISFWVPWVGLALVLIIWFATFIFSVPCHNTLMRGFDEEAWRTLVSTNWIRTIGWSARGGLLVFALFQIFRLPGAAEKGLTSPASSQKLTVGLGE